MKPIFKIFFLAVLMFVSTTLKANDGTKTTSISGKIIDIKSGETLAGALITVEGTDIQVYSDLDGNFKIEKVVTGINWLSLTPFSVQEVNER